MIPPGDRWGPFRSGLDAIERTARLRCLRTIVHLTTGRRGDALADLLRRAELDADALEPAVAAIDGLAPIDRRHVLASYAALNRT